MMSWRCLRTGSSAWQAVRGGAWWEERREAWRGEAWREALGERREGGREGGRGASQCKLRRDTAPRCAASWRPVLISSPDMSRRWLSEVSRPSLGGKVSEEARGAARGACAAAAAAETASSEEEEGGGGGGEAAAAARRSRVLSPVLLATSSARGRAPAERRRDPAEVGPRLGDNPRRGGGATAQLPRATARRAGPVGGPSCEVHPRSSRGVSEV